MLSRQLLLELAYWTPLITLLLLSLGLVGLKRISGLWPWAERLVAPPFCFVSLPIATLIVGIEIGIWVVDFVGHGAGEVSWPIFFFGKLFVYSLMLMVSPLDSFVFAIVSSIFFATQVFSFNMFERALSGGEDWRCPAKKQNAALRLRLFCSRLFGHG